MSVNSFTNNGTIETKNGATLTINNFMPNSGTIIAGVGGLININGGFTSTTTGNVNVLIAGTSTSQFGRVSASGAATLAGTLNVTLANGFTPALGQTFPVITFASHGASTFATINGLAIGGGMVFTPQYNATNLTLIVGPSPAPGLHETDPQITNIVSDPNAFFAASEVVTPDIAPANIEVPLFTNDTTVKSADVPAITNSLSNQNGRNGLASLGLGALDAQLSESLSRGTGKDWLFYTQLS